MRVAALSDFHIGVSAARDGFGHDLPAFEGFIDELAADHDRIVLLGDIFQTDHCMWPSFASRSRHLAAARRRARWLCERLETPGFVYVHGNHDEVAAELLNTPERVSFEGARARALFIHGHQFDPVANRAQWAANLGTWFTGRLRAVGLRTVGAYFERRDVEIKDERFRGATGPYVRAGRTLAREHAAQVVVMGHTHCARIDVTPDAVVANTGTCSAGRRAYVSMDLDARWIQLVDGDRVEQRSL